MEKALKVEKKVWNEKQLRKTFGSAAFFPDEDFVGWLLGIENGLIASPGVKTAEVYFLETPASWNRIAPDFARACKSLRRVKRVLVRFDVPKDFTFRQSTALAEEMSAVIGEKATLKWVTDASRDKGVKATIAVV